MIAKKKLQLFWVAIKMVAPLYLNFLHFTLKDMNALYCRAEDRRMKSFRMWLEDGTKLVPDGWIILENDNGEPSPVNC